MNDTIKTPLDICNKALAKLGESPISKVDPYGTPAQRLCYDYYHPNRREVLCATRWKFATMETQLTSTDGKFRLPDDCLRVLEVSSPSWTLRGRGIYCPAQRICLTYISDIEDCTLFEPLFIEAFATRLAAKICMPLTRSHAARQALIDEWYGMKFDTHQ